MSRTSRAGCAATHIQQAITRDRKGERQACQKHRSGLLEGDGMLDEARGSSDGWPRKAKSNPAARRWNDLFEGGHRKNVMIARPKKLVVRGPTRDVSGEEFESSRRTF